MIDCLTYNKDLNVILDVGTQAITASLENSSITNFVYAKRIDFPVAQFQIDNFNYQIELEKLSTTISFSRLELSKISMELFKQGQKLIEKKFFEFIDSEAESYTVNLRNIRNNELVKNYVSKNIRFKLKQKDFAINKETLLSEIIQNIFNGKFHYQNRSFKVISSGLLIGMFLREHEKNAIEYSISHNASIESENIELIGTYGANYIYTYPLDNQLIVYIFSNRVESKPILFYQSPKLVKLATYMPEEQFGIFYNLKFCSDKNFIVKKLILET